MPLANSLSIQEYGFVREKIGDKAAKFVKRASQQMKDWMTADVYGEIDDQHASYDEARQAESLLALSFALPQLNMRFSDLGGLSKIIGIDSQNSEELMSFFQIKRYQEELRKQAFQLIEGLIPDLDDDPDSFNSGGFSIHASTNYADPENARGSIDFI